MKKKEHDDMMDLFNFIFGEPIGKVNNVTVDDIGLSMKATLRRPSRSETTEINDLIQVNPSNAIKEFDVDGNLKYIYFKVDDEALTPILIHNTLKVSRPQIYASISKPKNDECCTRQQKKSKLISEMLKGTDVIDKLPQQIKINISELEEIQCKVCKAKFQPNTEFHYVTKTKSPITLFTVADELLHDAYDCPLCGSQIILGERLERLK